MSTKTKKVEDASKGFAKAIAEAMREEERKAGLLIKAHERDQQAAGSAAPGLSDDLLEGRPSGFGGAETCEKEMNQTSSVQRLPVAKASAEVTRRVVDERGSPTTNQAS